MEQEEKRTHNSTYKKLAIQWSIEVLCFASSALLADSFRLRNRQLLVAAKRYAAVSPNPTETIMKRRKLIYFLLIGISILGILIAPYGILNTMVSLKYETENITDCVSNVSGENLCETIRNLKIVFVICVLSLFALIYFRKRILKSN